MLDHTPNRRADLTRAIQQVLWSSNAQRGARPIRYAALLHSRDSQAYFKAEHNSEFYGYYEVLRGEHMPVEVITEHGVQQGDLDGFKVLIVPDAVCLADETIAEIERFVEAGGGLVATYRSGEQDPDGNIRAEAGFAGLTGVRPIKLVAFDAELTYPSREAMVNIPSIDVSPGKSFFRYARAAGGPSGDRRADGRAARFPGRLRRSGVRAGHRDSSMDARNRPSQDQHEPLQPQGALPRRPAVSTGVDPRAGRASRLRRSNPGARAQPNGIVRAR